MRLIDGDALRESIEWCKEQSAKCNDSYWDDILERIDVQPTIDAVPVVHGRWIDHKDEHQCSVCKESTIVDFYVWRAIQFDFCPYCGAKMDGERREE